MSEDAIIALSSVVLGFGLGFIADLVRVWWRTKSERESIAAVLLVEIFSQGDWCAKQGSKWNAFEQSGGQIELAQLRQGIPPIAAAFNSVVEKIGAFQPSTASKILAFHGSLNVINAAIEAYSTERNVDRIPRAQINDIAKKWRATCFNALLAIRALEPIAKMPELPNDSSDLSALKDDLLLVANNGIIGAEA